jgi:hypothetical protein
MSREEIDETFKFKFISNSLCIFSTMPHFVIRMFACGMPHVEPKFNTDEIDFAKEIIEWHTIYNLPKDNLRKERKKQ